MSPFLKKRKERKGEKRKKKAFLFFEPRTRFAKRKDLEPRKPGIWFNLKLRFINERTIVALAGCRYFQVTAI